MHICRIEFFNHPKCITSLPRLLPSFSPNRSYELEILSSVTLFDAPASPVAATAIDSDVDIDQFEHMWLTSTLISTSSSFTLNQAS